MQQIQPEVLATLLAIIGAILGYAFREYRNKVRPFFQLSELTGGLTKRSDDVQVEQDIVDKLSNTFYIKELDQKNTLGEVWDRWDRADDVESYWPKVRDYLDKVLAATTDEALIRSLPELFELKYFGMWMMLMLVGDRIKFSKIPKALPTRIQVFDSEDKKGCVWFSFPTNAQDFGNNFSEPVIRSKCTPFINSIKYLHRDSLFSILRQYKDILENEYKAAVSSIHALKAIKDNHSRWDFFCYFANLSQSPVVIENRGGVSIFDKGTKFKLTEECYLANLQTNEGKRSILDTINPIILRGGADAEFVFITKHTQSQMELGKHLREVFERGRATVRLSFRVRKVGLLKRQRYVSPSFPFVESSD
jgi:hypothetical protein